MAQRIAWIVLFGSLFLLTLCSAQDLSVSDPEVVHPNIRVSVPDVSPVKTLDDSGVAVAKAAVATVLSALSVRCEPASQLNAVLEANGGAPLSKLAKKLAGASCMMDGKLLHLSAEFTPNGSIQADGIIAAIMHGKPLLIRWNNALYVLYGVVYDEHLHNSGKRENVIRQLLLIDSRYSDERKFVRYNRQSEDFSRVEGIAELRFLVP